MRPHDTVLVATSTRLWKSFKFSRKVLTLVSYLGISCFSLLGLLGRRKFEFIK